MAFPILLVFAFLVLVVGPGGAGADFLKDHDAPFVDGLQEVYGERVRLSQWSSTGWAFSD